MRLRDRLLRRGLPPSMHAAAAAAAAGHGVLQRGRRGCAPPPPPPPAKVEGAPPLNFRVPHAAAQSSLTWWLRRVAVRVASDLGGAWLGSSLSSACQTCLTAHRTVVDADALDNCYPALACAETDRWDACLADRAEALFLCPCLQVLPFTTHSPAPRLDSAGLRGWSTHLTPAPQAIDVAACSAEERGLIVPIFQTSCPSYTTVCADSTILKPGCPELVVNGAVLRSGGCDIDMSLLLTDADGGSADTDQTARDPVPFGQRLRDA